MARTLTAAADTVAEVPRRVGIRSRRPGLWTVRVASWVAARTRDGALDDADVPVPADAGPGNDGRISGVGTSRVAASAPTGTVFTPAGPT